MNKGFKIVLIGDPLLDIINESQNLYINYNINNDD